MEFEVQPCELSQHLANILQRKGLTAKAEYIANNLTHFITLKHASLLLCNTWLLSPAFGSYIALHTCCRPLQAEEEDILREALLASGTDPEAPVDSSRKRRRSWYSLLGTAITYVWPDSPILQLRAFTCILLILIMRVLNLAVPILYKKVVDTLASTSEGTHPRPGEEREYYHFWQVCLRCQCSAKSRH